MQPVGHKTTTSGAPVSGGDPHEPAADNSKQIDEGLNACHKPISSTAKASAIAEGKMTETAWETYLRKRYPIEKHPETKIDQDPNLDGNFCDADKLGVARKDYDAKAHGKMMHDMIRSDLNGSKPGAFFKTFPETFAKSSDEDKEDHKYALHDALQDKELTKKIDSDPKAKARMDGIVRQVAGTDPSIKENAKADAAVKDFKDWDSYKYKAIIVPGYTPLGQDKPLKLDPVAKERLAAAAEAYKNHAAPFVIVSGGNCHPTRTPYNEAYEMKQELKKMGVPEDHIIVDMRAQHSTTNLRNSARYMFDHGMIKTNEDGTVKDKEHSKAMIITGGGPGAMFDQKFYMAKPDESTFHKRCKDELGYKVGDLRWMPTDKGNDLGPGLGTLTGPGFQEGYVEYTPSEDCKKFNYKDPLDP